jgi:hypothetical protein
MHPRQAEFVNCPARIVVAACGTKTGKTFGMSMWLLKNAWNNYQSVNWWTAPTYRQAKIAFNLMGSIMPPDRAHRRASAGEMVYELLRDNGSVHSTIEFRSADNPESLRGEGVHACVIDEAGYWGYDSFVSVWTTLTRTRGKLRIISTPKGRNWFYDEWLKGWDGDDGQSGDADLRKKFPEFKSFKLPTHTNPLVPRQSIIEAKRTLPEDVFRQEYLAEFLDESAGVFRNIRACMTGQWLDSPKRGAHYIMGIDWAKKNDYTVFCFADRATREIVHIQRHNGVEWNSNINMAFKAAKEWNNAQIYMDSTGVGDVPFDELRSIYPHVHGYSISTNASKKALIEKMQFSLEKNLIILPKADSTKRPEPKILHKELSMYGYEVAKNGMLKYSAPEGYFDDCVIAACLANWPLNDAPLVYKAKSIRGI